MGLRVDVRYRKANGFKKQSDVDRDCLSNALKKFKKALDKSGKMREVRQHEFYEKPSEKRKRKKAREISNAQKATQEREEQENVW